MALVRNFLTFAAIVLSTSFSFGAGIDRRPYVTEAVQEMEFYFRFLSESENFISLLTPAETTQFKGILKVTGVLAKSKGVQIVYSQNPNDFILHPGEPERSARTSDNIKDPIFVNLPRLNSADSSLQYLDVVQLLVHELGHKLGKDEDQVAVDTMSSKMVTFLTQYLRKNNVIWNASDGRRVWKEYFESLSLPKDLTEENPDPTVFYVYDGGPRKIEYYFKKIFADVAKDRVVQLERLTPEYLNNTNLISNFTVFKKFKTSDGVILAPENSYYMDSFFFIVYEQISQQPYDHQRLVWTRNTSNYNFQIKAVREVASSKQQVQWDLDFTGTQNPKSFYLLVGTESQDAPYPCNLIASNGINHTVRCTYKIPRVSASYSIDVLSLLVDGEVADLPEKIVLDLERDFKVRMVMSDQQAKKFTPIKENGKTRYELITTSPYKYQTVLVRCIENQDYIYNGSVVGQIQKTIETIFFEDKLPVKSQEKDTWTFSVSCENNGILSEILLTDETGYTMSPRWK